MALSLILKTNTTNLHKSDWVESLVNIIPSQNLAILVNNEIADIQLSSQAQKLFHAAVDMQQTSYSSSPV